MAGRGTVCWEKVFVVGGLCVIGTERHGKCVSSGESQFYLSLEDELWGSERIKLSWIVSKKLSEEKSVIKFKMFTRQ